MDKSLIGALVFFGFWHLYLVLVPVRNVMRARISLQSRLFWSAVLLFIPFLGVAVMHFFYGTGLLHKGGYELSAAEERARSGTLAPDDRD